MDDMRGRILFSVIALGLIAVTFLFYTSDHTFEFVGEGKTVLEKVVQTVQAPEPPAPVDPNADIEKQPQLAAKPKVVKAIYITGYAAGSQSKMTHLNDVLDTTEINAVVLDVKDYTGMVSYEPDVEDVKKYDAFEIRIPKINKLIKSFHDRGIYVIGRIAVFQDQALVKARPDLALHSISTGKVWRDKKGVAWLDTGSTEVWDYNAAIATDALTRGFDEINLDYIRFASDGNVDDIQYSFYDPATLKHNTVKKFFEHMRTKLPSARLSADIFGMVTEDPGDMGIGQHLEDSLSVFDYVAPMAYPSHYGSGYRGFQSPANHPYEVMKFAIDSGLSRLTTYNLQQTTEAQKNASSSSSSVISGELSVSARAKFRPWIQDFDLGADYTAAMVRAQIQAIYDSGCSATMGVSAEGGQASTPAASRVEPCDKSVDGWMVWNPSNVYTKEAFLTE